jgi:hypothetical protein
MLYVNRTAFSNPAPCTTILSLRMAASSDLTIWSCTSGCVASPWKQSHIVSIARSIRGDDSGFSACGSKGTEKYE